MSNRDMTSDAGRFVKNLEMNYASDKGKLFALYDNVYEILGGNGENSICNELYGKGKCCCCEFPEVSTDSRGKPCNTFTGMLPYEREYLAKIRGQSFFNEKFKEHDSGLGLICNKVEVPCSCKPIDCAVYPYCFGNFSTDGSTATVDILGSFEKCPVFEMVDFRDKFLSATLSRMTKLARFICGFDHNILVAMCLFSPF